jgi:RNA polymerase-binding transcription factor DksA
MKDKIAILKGELEELQAQIITLQSVLDERPEYGLGKGAPAVTQWELDHALLRQLKDRAAGIEDALLSGEVSAYGICEQCGRPIHPDRLAAIPATRTCIRCARVGGHDEADNIHQ